MLLLLCDWYSRSSALSFLKNNVSQGAPTAEEMGFANVVTVEEVGSTKVTVFRQDKEDSQISTLIVRASTQNILDDLER